MKSKRKVCPNCRRRRTWLMFGVRVLRGTLALQSWCRDCRGMT